MTTTASGSLGISPDGRFRIHFDRVLSHPVDRVWTALVEPDRLSVWMEGCRINAHVRGGVHFDFGDEGAATGVVTEVTAPVDATPGTLVHTWEWEGLPTSEVTWSVTSVDGGTRLQLTHAELLEAGAADFALGWDVIVETLSRHLEGASLDGVWDDAERTAGEYAEQLAALRSSTPMS